MEMKITTSRWGVEPTTTAKGRGIGCLLIVVLYFLIGLAFWKDANWNADPFVLRAYVLAPVAWPFAIVGFIPREVAAARIATAIACDLLYGWLLYRYIWAKTRGVLWRSIILLILLFLLAWGGCFAEVGQAVEGVC